MLSVAQQIPVWAAILSGSVRFGQDIHQRVEFPGHWKTATVKHYLKPTI